MDITVGPFALIIALDLLSFPDFVVNNITEENTDDWVLERHANTMLGPILKHHAIGVVTPEVYILSPKRPRAAEFSQ